MRDFLPVIQNKKFMYLWISQILSQLTIYVMNFLFLVRIITLTNSSIAASLLWLAYALPAVLIGPVAAALVDIWERRKILIITNLLQALVIFISAFVGNDKFFILFGVVFIYSFINQFYVPAEQATLPSVVSKEQFSHANSLFFITQQSAIVVGFGLAGPLLKLLNFTNSLYLCSFFLFLAFVSTTFLPKLSAVKKLPEGLEGNILDFFKSIIEGYRFIKQHNKILFPFLLLMGIQIGVVIAVVNAPIVGSQILKIAVTSIGIGVIVPTGLGAAVGAVLTPKLLRKGFRKKTLIEISLLVMGVSLVCLAFIGFLGLYIKLSLAFLILFLLGLSFISILIPAQTFLQEVTPGGLRGRVFGNFWFLTTIATIIPILFSATITEILGPKILILMVALVVFITYLISKRYVQRLLLNQT